MSNDELNYSDMNWCKETIESLRQQLAECERKAELPMKYKRMEFNAQLQKELATVTKQRDELLADANRYRYLRNASRRECLDIHGPDAGCWIDCEDEAHTLRLLTEDDADAAIDAAIAKVGASSEQKDNEE